MASQQAWCASGLGHLYHIVYCINAWYGSAGAAVCVGLRGEGCFSASKSLSLQRFCLQDGTASAAAGQKVPGLVFHTIRNELASARLSDCSVQGQAETGEQERRRSGSGGLLV